MEIHILLQVKKYIKTHGQVTSEHLCNKFDITKTTLEGIIQVLVNQGYIQHLAASSSCSSSCNTGCNSGELDTYYWLNRKLKAIEIPVQN